MRTLRTLPSTRQVRANRAPARPDNHVCPALQGRRHATPAEAAAPQASTQASAVSVAQGTCAAVAQTTWTSAPLSAHAREWACPGCSKPCECLSGRLGPKGPSKGQKKSEAAAPGSGFTKIGVFPVRLDQKGANCSVIPIWFSTRSQLCTLWTRRR